MSITIYGELHSAKNGKDIIKVNGRFMLISKKPVRDAEKELLIQLRQNQAEWEELKEYKRKPLYVVFTIYRKTKRRFDYINIVQQLCDCMVKVGWLEDDSADHIIPVFQPYKVDKDNPRVEIDIL